MHIYIYMCIYVCTHHLLLHHPGNCVHCAKTVAVQIRGACPFSHPEGRGLPGDGRRTSHGGGTGDHTQGTAGGTCPRTVACAEPCWRNRRTSCRSCDTCSCRRALTRAMTSRVLLLPLWRVQGWRSVMASMTLWHTISGVGWKETRLETNCNIHTHTTR